MTSTATAPQVELVRTMGTVVTLDVRDPAPPAALRSAYADAAEQLYRADELLSTWQQDSWASRLLRGDVGVADCPRVVAELVELSAGVEELTDGYFSPRWRPGGPAVGPDVTGLVKGWAAQRASDALLDHGLPDHVVNAAGDLVVSGSPLADAASPWRVGIANPADPAAVVGALRLEAGPSRWVVATSGTAERGLHVVDPHTGRRPATVASATCALAVSATWPQAGAVADACATALVAAGGMAPDLLDRLAGRGVVGVVVAPNGTVLDPAGLLR